QQLVELVLPARRRALRLGLGAHAHPPACVGGAILAIRAKTARSQFTGPRARFPPVDRGRHGAMFLTPATKWRGTPAAAAWRRIEDKDRLATQEHSGGAFHAKGVRDAYLRGKRRQKSAGIAGRPCLSSSVTAPGRSPWCWRLHWRCGCWSWSSPAWCWASLLTWRRAATLAASRPLAPSISRCGCAGRTSFRTMTAPVTRAARVIAKLRGAGRRALISR